MRTRQGITEQTFAWPRGAKRLPLDCVHIPFWRTLDPRALLYFDGWHWRRVLGPIYAPHLVTWEEFDAIARRFGAAETTRGADDRGRPVFHAVTPGGSRMSFSPRGGIISGPWFRRHMSIGEHLSYLFAVDDGDVDEDAQVAGMMAFLSGAYDQGAA